MGGTWGRKGFLRYLVFLTVFTVDVDEQGELFEEVSKIGNTFASPTSLAMFAVTTLIGTGDPFAAARERAAR